MRSQYSASSRKCVVTITVTPRSTMALMCDQNSRRVSGSTPEVGSSRKSTAGSCMTAQARASRCLKPSGSSPAFAVEIRSQSKRRGHALELLAPASPRQSVDAREEVQVLAYAQVAVERELLGHVAHASAGGAGGLVQVEAGHAGTAGGRPQQAAHHLERGRLAGAVGAQQAEDLAAADAEGDLVGGREVAEPLGQPVRLHDRPPSSLPG